MNLPVLGIYLFDPDSSAQSAYFNNLKQTNHTKQIKMRFLPLIQNPIKPIWLGFVKKTQVLNPVHK